MEQQKTFSTTKNNKRPSANNLSYSIRRNWYWFVFAVIICLGLAFLFINYCPQKYTRTASVLIKENSFAHILSTSSEHPVEIKTNVGNEVFILKSRRLMLEVVKQLSLDISYIKNDGLRKTELYKDSPLIVSFPDASETDRFSFVATPVSTNKVQLSSFSNNNNETVTVNLKENNTVSTPLGKIMIKPSVHYGEKHFDIPITITKKNPEEVARYYSEKLNVRTPAKSASVIKISLDDVSAIRNEDIINTLIAIYDEETIKDKEQIIISTSDFLHERLLSLEKELDNTDTDTFKLENLPADINPATGLYTKSNNLNKQRITDLQNQRMLARIISDYILDPKRSFDLIPAYTISNVNIEKQITEYNNLILRRSKLLSNNSDEDQMIGELNNSLASIKQNIIRDIGNFILSTDNEIRNTPEFVPKKTQEAPTEQKQILPIEYQQKNNESLYFYLSKKREDNALLLAMIESDIKMIDPAKGPDIPTVPNTIHVFLVALMAGIILPLILLWLKSVLNTTVRSRNDIENRLSIPVLADIPLQKKIRPGEIVINENSTEPISEAFRIIRTNIDIIYNKAQSSQVIMLTSAVPGAGKTFVSANLAMSFALLHKKVILLDLDMRKGTLSSYINNSYSGISTFLSGKVNDINEIIIKKALHETLDFISAGPISQNPSELLISNRFDILIQDLKKHYDYIILDNATANVVADATIVNRISDLSIFIIRAGKMDRRQLPELEKQYQQNKYNNMNVILNGVDYKQFGNGYYEYYAPKK